jgi:hypothetical protein
MSDESMVLDHEALAKPIDGLRAHYTVIKNR